MRKLLLLIVVAVFAVSMPLSASALETSVHGILWTTFNYSTNVGAYYLGLDDDFDDDDDLLDARTYIYERHIPRLYLKFSDDLQFVLGWDTLTMDWGGDNAADSYGGNSPGYGFGAYSMNGTLTWHTRWSYADWRIPNTPVRVKMGVQTLRDVANMALLTGEFPAIRIDVPVGEGKLTAFWAQMEEGNERNADDDASFFGIQVAYPVNENFTITPQIYYATGDDEQDCTNQCIGAPEGYQGTTILWIGANVKGKLALGANPIALNITGFMATGEYDHTFNLGAGNTGDISGFFFEARASTNMDMGNFSLKPEVIFMISSGDGNLLDADREVWPAINSYYNVTNLFFVGFINYMTSVTNSASGELFRSTPGVPATANGITMFLFNAAIKPKNMPMLTLKPVVAFMMATEDWADLYGNDDTYMGTEIGAEVIVQLYKNLRWHTYLGTFLAGDFYKNVDGDPDDPEAAMMIKSSFAVLF